MCEFKYCEHIGIILILYRWELLWKLSELEPFFNLNYNILFFFIKFFTLYLYLYIDQQQYQKHKLIMKIRRENILKVVTIKQHIYVVVFFSSIHYYRSVVAI